MTIAAERLIGATLAVMGRTVFLIFLLIAVSITGGSASGAPIFDPSVTVASTTTIGSGGTDDWWGRASVVTRSDGVLIGVYYRAIGHADNGGALHIRFSDDEGDNWTAEDTDLDGNPVTGFPMNPPGLSGVQDAGEPLIFEAPSGDLLLHMWKVDYGGSNAGAWQSRSADGTSWGTPTQITWTGGSLSSTNTFATDQAVVVNGVIYEVVRTYDGPSYTDCFMSLVKSADDGETWEWVSDITGPSETAAIEAGLVYVGNNTFVTFIRDLAHVAAFKRVSTDLGATWGSLTDVTAEMGIAARVRAYTVSQLMGLPGGYQDPRIVLTGYVQMDPGNSQERRNAVWFSPDRVETISSPFYIDTQDEDGGYGDIWWSATHRQFRVWSSRGTLLASSLKQYDLSVSGL